MKKRQNKKQLLLYLLRKLDQLPWVREDRDCRERLRKRWKEWGYSETYRERLNYCFSGSKWIPDDIWPERELDLSRLTYDTTKYYIDWNRHIPDELLLDPEDRSIRLKEPFRSDVMSLKPVYDGIPADTATNLKVNQSAEPDGALIRKKLSAMPPTDSRLTLEEYYQLRIDNINSTTIESKDLLDQILLVYVIKRALNGDKKAIRKLVELYTPGAMATANRFILSKEKSFPNLNHQFKRDVRKAARFLLRLLISGDNPSNLMDLVSKARDRNTRQSESILKLLTRKVVDLYLNLYAINMWVDLPIVREYKQQIIKDWLKDTVELSKEVGNLDPEKTVQCLQLTYEKKLTSSSGYPLPKKIHEMATHMPSEDPLKCILEVLANYFQSAMVLLSKLETLEVAQEICLNPYSWAFGDPQVFGKRFNKNVFRPTKNTTFTTWLFGTIKDRWQGKLYQKLNDWYKSKEVSHIVHGRRMPCVEYLRGRIVSLEKRVRGGRRLKETIPGSDSSDMVELYQKKIGEFVAQERIGQRNAKILQLYSPKWIGGEKVTYKEVVQKTGLSEKQVGRIVRKLWPSFKQWLSQNL